MAQLFGYNLPAMLFYTLPVSFMVAVVTMLLRLSNENELTALFALGIKSNRVVRSISTIGISILYTSSNSIYYQDAPSKTGL